MKRLAIIPARKESKRFPSKNMAELGGKPLIFHTIDAGIELFDKLIFTSDSDEMLEAFTPTKGKSNKDSASKR